MGSVAVIVRDVIVALEDEMRFAVTEEDPHRDEAHLPGNIEDNRYFPH